MKKGKDIYGIKRPRQLHILVVFMLIVMTSLIGYVGYNLIRDREEQGAPVVGNRYKHDLDPKIDETYFKDIQADIESIAEVEGVSVNLKTATLRVNVNVKDDTADARAKDIAGEAWEIVKTYYDKDIYFTNTADTKMYDCEVTVYNYIPDEEHDAKGQIHYKVTKTGANPKPRVDALHIPAEPKLVKEIVKYDE